MINIVTHSNGFNLDELSAIALMNVFIDDNNFNIIRTRNKDLLKKYQKDDKTYVIDVGFKFEEDMLNFDHHQHNMTKTWSDGTPYSSCGLIWDHLKKNGKVQLSNLQINRFEQEFIKKVDAHDNGIKNFSLMNFVLKYNTKNSNPNIIDSCFKTALKHLTHYIIFMLNRLKKDCEDIFSDEEHYTDTYTSNLAALALISRFGYVDKIYEKTIGDQLFEFRFINKKGLEETYTLDFKNNRFCNDDKCFQYEGSMVPFIWEYLTKIKDVNMISQSMNDETANLLYKNFVEKFDYPTYEPNMTYIAILKHSNETFDFAKMAMREYLSNIFGEARTYLKSKSIVDKDIKNSSKYENIVVFSQNIKNALSLISEKNDDTKIAIFPRDRNSWTLKVVSKNFKSMPKKWSGLNEMELLKVSGIEGLIFSHKSGYMCMFKGSKEKAIELADNIIKNVY